MLAQLREILGVERLRSWPPTVAIECAVVESESWAADSPRSRAEIALTSSGVREKSNTARF